DGHGNLLGLGGAAATALAPLSPLGASSLELGRIEVARRLLFEAAELLVPAVLAEHGIESVFQVVRDLADAGRAHLRHRLAQLRHDLPEPLWLLRQGHRESRAGDADCRRDEQLLERARSRGCRFVVVRHRAPRGFRCVYASNAAGAARHSSDSSEPWERRSASALAAAAAPAAAAPAAAPLSAPRTAEESGSTFSAAPSTFPSTTDSAARSSSSGSPAVSVCARSSRFTASAKRR